MLFRHPLRRPIRRMTLGSGGCENVHVSCVVSLGVSWDLSGRLQGPGGLKQIPCLAHRLCHRHFNSASSLASRKEKSLDQGRTASRKRPARRDEGEDES